MNPTTAQPLFQAEDFDALFVQACNRKDFEAMQAALGKGGNIDFANVQGTTQLQAAVRSHRLDVIKWLMERGANPSMQNLTGDTALHDAAKREDPEALRILLTRRGVGVDVVNTLGSTPLIEAAIARRSACVKLLLKAGANTNHKTKQGASPLLISAGKHDEESVVALLDKGAEPNDVDSYGNTPLISAAAVFERYDIHEEEAPAKVASKKVIAALVKAGARVNHASKSGNTALAQASQCLNRPAMVELLDAGADPNVHSTAGVEGEFTPLMAAAFKHDVELINKICSRKAEVNFRNNKGDNALSWAMRGRVDDEKAQEKARFAIEALLKAGARPAEGVSDSSGLGLAHYAVLINSRELLETAKREGGLDHPGPQGMTAVTYALVHRNMDMLRALHELGASFGPVGEAQLTPLHLLARSPYPQQVVTAIAKMRQRDDEKLKADAAKLEAQAKQSALEFTKSLVEMGVDINAPSKKGDTPMHLALESFAFGRLDQSYLDFLLEQGADLTRRNENEESCFVRAVQIGNVELAQAWAQRLMAAGKGVEVETAIYDAAWTAPEHESQVKAMRKVFEALIPMGAMVDYRDEDGQFPLLIAAANNHEDMAGMLLDLGAEVDQVNNEGETAAFHSVKENHANVTKVLFERGANPDAVRNDGESLTTLAFRHQRSTALNQIAEYRPKWREAQEAKISSSESVRRATP